MKKISAFLFLFGSLLFSSASMAQINSPWAGNWMLDFKNIDDEETNFIAELYISNDSETNNLEGKIIYTYKDGTQEEAVIEHFNESNTELILGFKVEGSDALFFPLTLRFELDEKFLSTTFSGTLFSVLCSGSWEDEEESFTILGGRRDD
jgi:hypothetical protein